MTVLLIAIIFPVLATARITRLITTDRITEGLRGWVLDHLTSDRRQRAAFARSRDGRPVTVPPPRHPTIARIKAEMAWLVTCNWCASFWAALAACLLTRAAAVADIGEIWTGRPWELADIPLVLVWAFATSHVVGVLAEYTSVDVDDDTEEGNA